jgi:predicted nuclease with TOPRIM domain
VQEKDGLCHLLQQKEAELEELKERLSSLQADYAKNIRNRRNIDVTICVSDPHSFNPDPDPA